MEGGKQTRSKSASRPGKDPNEVPREIDSATNQSTNAEKTKDTQDPAESEGDDSLDLIIQVPGELRTKFCLLSERDCGVVTSVISLVERNRRRCSC
jgi:hypothetical protein